MQLTPENLIDDLRAMITGLFPDSHVSVGLSTIIGRTSIRILFAYGTRDSWQNGIIENDRAFHQFTISGTGSTHLVVPGFSAASLVQGAALPEKLCASCLQGRDVHGPNYRNVVKVGWREKNSGTAEQIVKHMTTYFTRLKAAIEAHPDADEWNDS